MFKLISLQVFRSVYVSEKLFSSPVVGMALIIRYSDAAFENGTNS